MVILLISNQWYWRFGGNTYLTQFNFGTMELLDYRTIGLLDGRTESKLKFLKICTNL